MIALGLLVLVATIVLVVYAATKGQRAPGPPTAPREVEELLARWTAAGLLADDQAEVLARHEAEVQAPVAVPASAVMPEAKAPRVARRVPVVAEALGYLGGILAVTGVVLVVNRYWPDMATAARLAISGAGVVGLLVAGWLVRPADDPALERLRGFAWVASTACAALFAGVVAADVFDAEAPETIGFAASAAVVVESGLLWRGRRLPFQQLTLFGAIAVLVGTGVASLTDVGPAGVAVWVAGAALVVVGLRRLAPMPLIGDVTGGLAMAVGSMLTLAAWEQAALLFAVATAGALVALALIPGPAPERADQLSLGIIGGFNGLQVAPAAVAYFAQDAALVTGIAVWAIGVLLLYLGIRALLRLPVLVVATGAIAVLVGAAVTAGQYEGVAPIFGILTAIGLVAAGMLPGQWILSLFGSAGLLINVLWAVAHFFPGEGRAPLLIMIAGALILTIAIVLTRSGKVRKEIGTARRPTRGPRSSPPTAAAGPA